MTPAVDATALPPRLMAELVARASDPGYPRWQEQVRRAGYCSRPVRLEGSTAVRDGATGALRSSWSTTGLPDGCLLKACGNRRATVCESCSAVYQSDAFQLLAAGLRGGKGVPESVAGHPCLFVTFTAPGFGPVHARRERGGRVERCRPRRDEVAEYQRRGLVHFHAVIRLDAARPAEDPGPSPRRRRRSTPSSSSGRCGRPPPRCSPLPNRGERALGRPARRPGHR